jgi:hypothetical protein
LKIPPAAPYPASSLPEAQDKLVILPLTDLHLPKASSKTIVSNQKYLERADFVVLLGDMVSCYATETEYIFVGDFIRSMGRPYTAVCGNHDWYYEVYQEDDAEYGVIWNRGSVQKQRDALEEFKHFYGVESLWRSFSNSLGHFVFLSLNGVGIDKQECLSQEQLAFLAQEVERAGGKPLFIFCHAPLMLGCRLNMVYYEEERTACVELMGGVRRALEERGAPSFWMSGHIHLHPDHPLFAPYRCGGNVWQIHCPDSWGFGRWTQAQWIPEAYEGPFSRHLEIDPTGVSFVTHDHIRRSDRESYRIDF